MSITMSNIGQNRANPSTNYDHHSTSQHDRFTSFDPTRPTNGQSRFHTTRVEEDDFFDSSIRSTRSQQQRDALVDSFTLFDSSNSSSSNVTTTSAGSTNGTDLLYNPIVFNQQFSQFQRATNGGKYFPVFPQQHQTTEITETGPDEEEEDQHIMQNPAGRMYVRDVDERDGVIQEQTDPQQGLYENYMIDYDADYDQYYDPNLHYHSGRPVHQQYTVEEADEDAVEDMDYYGNGNVVNGEHDVTMDMVSDAKTYGILLPPYQHFKQPPGQPQISPQFQMIQHPYMYGNPFSYNLHTIIEESENESSLQTLSSITSSNFQSLQFDQTNNSITPTNQPTRKSSQIGELSDPSLSPSQSSQSSPSLKEKFPGKQRHHSTQHENRRSSGENFSEISFTSSSTFSENGSEPDEQFDEDETFHVVTANVKPGEGETVIHNEADLDSTTSRLERYFTSSLLEANRSKANSQPSSLPTIVSNSVTPKVSPIETTTIVIPKIVIESPTGKQQTITAVSKPKRSTLEQFSPKLIQLRDALITLLTNSQYQPLTLDQINRLNTEILRLDWINFLKSSLTRTLASNFPVIGLKAKRLLRSSLSSTNLSIHTVDYLITHMLSTSAVHIIRDHQLAGFYICGALKDESPKSETDPETDLPGSSQIQITINQGQSMIIIKNDSRSNSTSMEVPQIPYRARKEVKLRAIQQKKQVTIESSTQDLNKTIYRTVLQVNDINGQSVPSRSEYYSKQADDRSESARLSKLLNHSNPLNRNFLVKTILNESSELEEKSKQQSEIYGYIQRKPSGEQIVSRDESDRSRTKSKPTLINSSKELLLGSLRSRSKERSRWNEENGNVAGNGSKYKTISNSSSSTHSKVSPTKSDSNHSRQKLDRSQKGSKSFRDQRPSINPSAIPNSHNSTWDSIYGNGIKLLKNISFVRSRSRSSSKERHDSSRRSSAESDLSDENSSRNKSLSEPNLHKVNRNKARGKSGSKEEVEVEGNEQNKTHNSKSTPHLTTKETTKESTENLTTATVSTPSLLYRLSNPAPTTSSMTIRSISTSSLRTRRRAPNEPERSHHHQMQYLNAESSCNGEWQEMTQLKEEIKTTIDSPRWTRKPSSMRLPVSESQSRSVHQSSTTTMLITSTSQYQRSEIVETRENHTKDITDGHSNIYAQVKPVGSEPLASSATVGELSVAVNYEMRIGSLEISINKCRIDTIKQKADLYVKVYLLPDRSKSSKRKTKVVKAYRSTTGRSATGQLQAEFNETLRFTGPFPEFTGRRLWLSIWNSDKFGRNGPVGEMVLGPLDPSVLSSGQLSTITWYRLTEPALANPKPVPTTTTATNSVLTQHHTVTSEHRSLAPSVSLALVEPEFAGSIFLALKYQTEPDSGADYQQSLSQGSLNILIKEAQNLQFSISTPNTIGSTFCKLTLLPERSKLDRDKSSPIKAPLEYSSNPRWNQTFVFQNLTTSELHQRALEISVWFQVEHAMQKSGKKLFVGGVKLSCDSSESMTEELSLWNQMLDRQNMWVYGEIPLRSFHDN